MEEALGLPKSKMHTMEEGDEPFEVDYSPAELKKIERDKIILDSAATKGASIPEICEILREKGFSVCQRTVWTVLHSQRATKFAEELERIQLRDIALLRAFALQNTAHPNLKALVAAISARCQLLRNFAPKESNQVNVEVNVSQQTTIEETKNLLAEYEHFFKETAETKNLPKDNPSE
jgi:hypothetical protein